MVYAQGVTIAEMTKNAKSFKDDNMDINVHHISEQDFEVVCKEFVSKHPECHYCPADWDWHAYPDVGFATLSNDAGVYITWGHLNYSYTPMG